MTLTAYQLACGYVQQYESKPLGERVKLYADEHHTCYWVHHYRSGQQLAIGYLNYSQSYPTLTAARRAYSILQLDIERRSRLSSSQVPA